MQFFFASCAGAFETWKQWHWISDLGIAFLFSPKNPTYKQNTHSYTKWSWKRLFQFWLNFAKQFSLFYLKETIEVSALGEFIVLFHAPSVS